MSYYDLLKVDPGEYASGPSQAPQRVRQRARASNRITSAAKGSNSKAPDESAAEHRITAGQKRGRDLRSIYQTQTANWSVYNDVAHTTENEGKAGNGEEFSSHQPRKGNDGHGVVFVHRVLGNSDQRNSTGDFERCVLVEWTQMRQNGNRIEWVAEEAAIGMQGGREAIREYQWNMSPVQSRDSSETFDRSTVNLATDGESPFSSGSSPLYETVAPMGNVGTSAGAAYEAARDAMRIRRRKRQLGADGTEGEKWKVGEFKNGSARRPS